MSLALTLAFYTQINIFAFKMRNVMSTFCIFFVFYDVWLIVLAEENFEKKVKVFDKTVTTKLCHSLMWFLVKCTLKFCKWPTRKSFRISMANSQLTRNGFHSTCYTKTINILLTKIHIANGKVMLRYSVQKISIIFLLLLYI